MINLPPIAEKITERPGDYYGKTIRMIPDEKYNDFWNSFYLEFKNKKSISLPFGKFKVSDVNKYSGFFGNRFHLAKLEQYFHIGLDITKKPKTLIKPIADGILEYAGFEVINGNYVLLQHPEIQTEDGYTLYSMYMNMSKYKVGFTKRQKMLREISLRTYPKIKISKEQEIGTVGDTGNSAKGDFHTHIQLELRKDGQIPIAIDPFRVFGYVKRENKTKNISTKKEFLKIKEKDLKYLKKYNLLGYFK